MRNFQFQKRKYSITINWFQAVDEFPDKFGIHLADLVSDLQKSNDTINMLMLDDNLAIQLMWYYVKQDEDTMEWTDFLKKLEGDELHKFRQEFWESVLDFSGPLKMDLLKQAWKGLKKELQETNLEELVSKSSAEESTQTP